MRKHKAAFASPLFADISARLAFVYVMILLFSASCGIAQSTELSEHRKAAHTAAHVDVETNVLIPSAHGPLHSVSFQYSFSEEKAIEISGLGRMPPSGALSYLTPDPQITISSDDGRLLEVVDLKDATQLMGGASSDSPTTSEFPDKFRVGFWKQEDPFSVHALKILNREFTSGLLPTISEANGENVLITAYQSLGSLPDDLFGEVAILVSHDSQTGQDGLQFRVRWVAREKRKLTHWRFSVGTATQRAADAFAGKILVALQSSDGR